MRKCHVLIFVAAALASAAAARSESYRDARDGAHAVAGECTAMPIVADCGAASNRQPAIERKAAQHFEPDLFVLAPPIAAMLAGEMARIVGAAILYSACADLCAAPLAANSAPEARLAHGGRAPCSGWQ